MNKDKVMPTVVLSVICAVVALLLSAINMVTGPVIEAQRNAAANEALLVVMPEGKDFEELDITTLGLSESITNVYKEASGGYVFRVVSTGYKPSLTIMVGINAEGQITGSKCIETQDTYGKEPQLDNSYNGQSIADFTPNMIGGATMTSSGYRDAINTALQSFTLASGGKLDPSIALEGKLAELAPGFVNPTAIETAGSFKKILKASNDAGFAYIFSDGENAFLTLVNATGGCIVYDAEGNDVTEAKADLASEAKAHASANQTSYTDALTKKIEKLMEGAAEITALELDTFNTVVSAVSFKLDGATYYGMCARPLTFGNSPMDVYVIIDENGTIVKQDVKQMAFGDGVEYMHGINEYLSSTTQAYKDYLNKFTGLTSETLTDDVLISGATVSSSAVKLATADAFAAFNSIKGGEQ